MLKSFIRAEYLQKGIYGIRNNDNGRLYVGSTTVSFRNRWLTHRSMLRTNKHPNYKIQKSWNKHGEEAFEFFIIEAMEADTAKILEVEQYYIDVFYDKHSYNIAMTVEQGKDLSKAMRAFWRNKFDSMSGSDRFMYAQQKAYEFKHSDLDTEQIDLILLVHENFPNATNGWIANKLSIDSGTVAQTIKRYTYLQQEPIALLDARFKQLKQAQAYIASVTELNTRGRPNKINEFKPMIKYFYDQGYSLRAIAAEIPELGYVSIRNALRALDLDPKRKPTKRHSKKSLHSVHK